MCCQRPWKGAPQKPPPGRGSTDRMNLKKHNRAARSETAPGGATASHQRRRRLWPEWGHRGRKTEWTCLPDEGPCREQPERGQRGAGVRVRRGNDVAGAQVGGRGRGNGGRTSEQRAARSRRSWDVFCSPRCAQQEVRFERETQVSWSCKFGKCFVSGRIGFVLQVFSEPLTGSHAA